MRLAVVHDEEQSKRFPPVVRAKGALEQELPEIRIHPCTETPNIPFVPLAEFYIREIQIPDPGNPNSRVTTAISADH